jgi:hypothetical protein
MTALAELLAEARAAGIRLAIKPEGRLEMRARRAPPPELIERIKEAKPALLAVLGAAMVETPSEWGAGAFRLYAMPVPSVAPSTHWAALVAATRCFIDDGWGRKASALGWRAVDLWGCHAERPAQRLDLAGALWLVGSGTIAAIAPMTISLRTHTGARLTIYRRCLCADEPIVLAWDLPQ